MIKLYGPETRFQFLSNCFCGAGGSEYSCAKQNFRITIHPKSWRINFQLQSNSQHLGLKENGNIRLSATQPGCVTIKLLEMNHIKILACLVNALNKRLTYTRDLPMRLSSVQFASEGTDDKSSIKTSFVFRLTLNKRITLEQKANH